MDIKDTKIILASGSPRRIEMMQKAGAEPVIVKPSCKENICTDLTPEQTVMALALRKNLDVCEKLDSKESSLMLQPGDNYTVVSADTVVSLDGAIYGKPKDAGDDFRMLKSLSGKVHQVITGVCLYSSTNKTRTLFSNSTDVFVRNVSDDLIRTYVDSGEPMDKAGAYAIQGGFAPYIDHIDGDYNNVVGFPMDDFLSHLSEL